jgi:long-chain acyl-CoA synthetase
VVGRVVARLAKQVELALTPLDLTPPQYRVLFSLAEGSALTSVLADQLAVTRPTVSAVVDGLVERGLIERRHDPADRRRVALTLTDQGLELLAAADDAIATRLDDIAGFLGDKGKAKGAIAGLDSWRQALDGARAAKTAAAAAKKEAVRA